LSSTSANDYFVDSHIHLSDYSNEAQISEIINYLQSTNSVVFCMSENVKTCELTSILANKFPDNVKNFVGIHPKYASQQELENFQLFYENNSVFVDGIGEIGLDKKYHPDINDFSTQKKIFEILLEFAEQNSKPVSVHSRMATRETLDLLQSYNLSVMLHWFSGNTREMKDAQDLGYYLSFGPASVYSKKLQKLIIDADRSLTLVESDGPVHYSVCFPGSVSDVRYVPSVLHNIANLWHEEFSYIINIICNNSVHYLNSK